MKNKIAIAVVFVSVLIALIGVRMYWQASMPDDSDIVCSLKTGHAYVVNNGFSGVFLKRRQSLDAECEKRLK
jgi:hypothetical protein